MEDPVGKGFLSNPADRRRRSESEGLLNTFCREKQVYDLLLLADLKGRVLATNTVQRDGTPLPEALLHRILGQDLRVYA